jgi:N6-adenosine-specific RNA methylase IME4
LKHSEKPQEVRDRIVTLMGDLPRIELFARTKKEGWDSWGDEIESDIDIPFMNFNFDDENIEDVTEKGVEKNIITTGKQTSILDELN